MEALPLPISLSSDEWFAEARPTSCPKGPLSLLRIGVEGKRSGGSRVSTDASVSKTNELQLGPLDGAL